MLVPLSFGSVTGWSKEIPEYQLKAAFLYNFTLYTDWPGSFSSDFHLCIYGDNPFQNYLDPLNGKQMGDLVFHISHPISIESVDYCQLLFVAQPAMAQLPELLDFVSGKPILTVADTPGSAHKGVILNLRKEQDRIAIEANITSARKNGLKLSSKLLRLAKEIVQ